MISAWMCCQRIRNLRCQVHDGGRRCQGPKSSTINVKGDGQQLQTETESCIGYFWLFICDPDFVLDVMPACLRAVLTGILAAWLWQCSMKFCLLAVLQICTLGNLESRPMTWQKTRRIGGIGASTMRSYEIWQRSIAKIPASEKALTLPWWTVDLDQVYAGFQMTWRFGSLAVNLVSCFSVHISQVVLTSSFFPSI